MKFGICGYGNLGKAVENNILKRQEDNIVGIFSRREGVESRHGLPVYNYDQAKNFVGQIDVMLMCGGSQEDLLWQSPNMLQYFNILDTFDTHARVLEHKKRLEEISSLSGYSAIYSCGWDPGLFSMVRLLCDSVFKNTPQTFWGRGVSQGHSEALRNIKGVKDAIQFTVPNEEIIKKVKNNAFFVPNDNEKHIRECYLALDGSRSEDEITEEIINTENYFKNQKVIVNFVSEDEVKALKEKMFHQGLVIGQDEDSSMEFVCKMENNPNFTSQVMLAYAHVLPKLKRGVYSIFDIPIKELSDDYMKFL